VAPGGRWEGKGNTHCSLKEEYEPGFEGF